jgi:hypothetical protein
MNQQTAEKVAIGLGGVGIGMGISALYLIPKIRKVVTMNKLATELLDWGTKNGLRMPTVELDHDLYEKISYIGIAARGMK